MSCNSGVGKGTFCDMGATWTPCCGNLRPTIWNPYNEKQYVANSVQENFGSCSYNCTGGYGRGCGCGGSQGGCKCGPYNKLGPEPHHHKHGHEGYYDTLSTEWSVAANVTPANHDLAYNYTHWKHKENYDNAAMGCSGCHATQYRNLKGTWGGQNKYTLG